MSRHGSQKTIILQKYFDSNKEVGNYQGYTRHTESIESILLHNELEIKIYQVINDLPSRLRSPCIMYFIREMSYLDIAQKCDISMDNVYKRISDARKIIKKSLSEYLLGEDNSILENIALPSVKIEKTTDTNLKEAIKKDVQPILLVQSEAKGEILHNQGRKCPHCQSIYVSKNGKRRGKQNYKCKKCDRQFIETYTKKGYATEMKEHCLNLHINGMGFRAIERETGISHNTVINWIKQQANWENVELRM